MFEKSKSNWLAQNGVFLTTLMYIGKTDEENLDIAIYLKNVLHVLQWWLQRLSTSDGSSDWYTDKK